MEVLRIGLQPCQSCFCRFATCSNPSCLHKSFHRALVSENHCLVWDVIMVGDVVFYEMFGDLHAATSCVQVHFYHAEAGL